MEKNQIELIKELMKYDLRINIFSIWKREIRETHNVEYTFCWKYSTPCDDNWERIANIGGDFETEYTEEYINCKIFGY